jgi:hypothetical protein
MKNMTTKESMKNNKRIASALALIALVVAAPCARGQSTYTPYTFTTLAGNAGYGSADGTGSAARFKNPGGVATDTNGNVYVTDSGNHTIRKVTPAGVVTTLAGVPGVSGTNNGTGSAARFDQPQGIAVDTSGNVYVADSGNHIIRKVSPVGANWVVTTLAGLPSVSGTNDGAGSASRFNQPNGVAVDTSGNVYVGDTLNYTIRKVTPAGVVTTLAGVSGSFGNTDGTGSGARFSEPGGVVVDSAGNVYVADSDNHTIRQVTPAGEVTTLAGGCHCGEADGTGSAAGFRHPYGIAVDNSGNVYVAEAVGTIRQMTQVGADWVVRTLSGREDACCTSVDGTGTAAQFYGPGGLAVDGAGNVYVADTGNNTIRQMAQVGADWVVTTFAGLVGSRGSQDGTGSAAGFDNPRGMALDGAGNVYVVDEGNSTIRQVTPAGVVTTLAGMAGWTGTNDGTGSDARFYYPSGIAVDGAGNIYVADTFNQTIRQMTPIGADWVVTTLAGMAGSSGTNDGAGSAARFSQPGGMAVDTNGNIYVADSGNSTIRRVTPAGVVTTLAGISAGSSLAVDIAVDTTGNIYLAYGNTIRKVTPVGTNWVVTTLAGTVDDTGSVDGTGSAARFFYPSGVAVDSAGNVYVSDFLNYTIRKVTPGGAVTTLAGLAESQGSTDGTGSAARFNNPQGVVVDSAGNLYVADSYNYTIRKGTPALQFNTSAGSLTVSNGLSRMRLLGPSGSNVVVEASANLTTWTPVQTNALPPFGLDVSVPVGTNHQRFFRARLAP